MSIESRAAALGAASALVGALLGTTGTIVATQLSANHAASAEVRANKAAAYKTAIGAERQATSIGDALWLARNSREAEGQIRDLSDQFVQALRRVHDAGVDVDVYGSPEAQDAVTDFLEIVGSLDRAESVNGTHDVILNKVNATIGRLVGIANRELKPG